MVRTRSLLSFEVESEEEGETLEREREQDTGGVRRERNASIYSSTYSSIYLRMYIHIYMMHGYM
jgi:hypothetical protein